MASLLYQLHEMQRMAFAPARLMAEMGVRFYRSPLVPVSYTRAGRAAAAACEMFERATRQHAKPAFGLATTMIDGNPVAVTEKVVLRRQFCDLLHFERDTTRQDPKVLIVAPLSGHWATLLRDTVAAMLPEHDVHITDWIDAREIPARHGAFTLDDYIDYVMEFVKFLGPDTHVIAVCQPAVPVLAAVSLLNAANDPAAPASMTLMGGPIDTRRAPTKVNAFAKEHSIDWFEERVCDRVPLNYPGFGRHVYPGFVQLSGFMAMNLDRHVGAHLKQYEHLVQGDGQSAESHRRFYNEYLAVMDLPAEYYLQTVRTVFQEHALPKGEMFWRGIRIEPSAITRTALLTVEGELDDISGVGQTVATHDLCTNLAQEKKRHHLQTGVGHYGIFNGRKWRSDILPVVAGHIRAS